MSMFRCTFECGAPLVVEAVDSKDAIGKARRLAWSAMARLGTSYEVAKRWTRVTGCFEMVEEGSCGRP